MIRQGSNLSKPNSRQNPSNRTTPRQTPGKNNRRVSINDAEFDKAMEKQLSSLDKKKSSNARPRLGGAEGPRLGAPPKPPTPEPEPEQTPPEMTEAIQEQDEEDKVTNQTDEVKKSSSRKKSKKRRKVNKEGEEDKASDEYSLEFESESESESEDVDDLDIIAKVRDENNRFVMEKFDAVMKAFSEASELPDINEADYDSYISTQKQLILTREKTHSDWLENFIKKKENVLYRLGAVSRSRGERYNQVCNIAAGVMGMPLYPPLDSSSKKGSTTSLVSKRMSRSRSRDVMGSRETSKERDVSRGRSQERSIDKLAKGNSSEVLPEIIDLKEELMNSSPTIPPSPISGAPPIKGAA